MVSPGQQTFCATTPHFFKVILDDNSRDLKLVIVPLFLGTHFVVQKIPKKFLIKYGEDLLNTVCLKLPSGSEWEVELIRCKGKAWFEKGWPEFSRFCCLDCGNFLVFRYEGNSTFEACIFDRTATEIDYPITVPKIYEDENDDLSIEILEFPPCPKTREKPSLLYPDYPLCKKMRPSSSTRSDRISENESAQPDSMVLFEKSMPNKDSHCSNSEMKGKGDFLAKKNTAGGSSCTPRFLKQTVDHEVIENAIAHQRATAFKLDDNPFFKISMKPSNIHKSILSLPSEFSKRHLIKLPAGIATLQVSSGRTSSVKTWSVKFKYDFENSKAQLLNGWSAFVRDNNLKVRDVCGFILMDRIELLFEVALPNVEAPNFPSPPVKKPIISGQVTHWPSSSLRDSRVNLEAGNKFVPKNPYFLVTLGSLHKEKSNVSVPAAFVKSFIKEANQTLKLQVKDRSWPVKVIRFGKNSAKFSGGWAAFAKENGLEKGDVCIFELMEINDIVLKVHIFRCRLKI
ncbi:putative transcription factor B3-Domain family [Rosa chinensis]|uniref:Putative transcription factor B3-Domain family n=1 Tax=Rosa chinensis TaxID=74649 RepID=A0A2P6RMZ4_ROSCH|nr:putative transcription factor B3-Domain family [Rosa chinensis]